MPDPEEGRLALHLSPQLLERVRQAAAAHEAEIGVRVLLSVAARKAIVSGLSESEAPGRVVLRSLDESMLADFDHDGSPTERLFIPPTPGLKAKIRAVAETLSTPGARCHPNAAARALLRSGLVLVDGRAQLRGAP
jgi:hypothetical protein